VLIFGSLAVFPALHGVAQPVGDPAEGRFQRRVEPIRVDLPAGGVEVPMQRQLHLPVVEAMVNGQGPFRFGLDTGASGALALDKRLIEEIDFPSVGDIEVYDGTGVGSRRTPVRRVDTLAIGGAVFHDLDAISGDYNRGPLGSEPIDGIIGIGLFWDLTLTLDYPADRVRISREALPEPNGRNIFALDPDGAIPTIPVRIGDQTYTAHLDARNMGALVIPSEVAATLAFADEPRVIGQARTQVNTIEIKGATLDGPLWIGEFEFQNLTAVFADIFRTLNVGSRIMGEFTITLDGPNSRVRFARDDRGPIRLPTPQPAQPR